MKHSSQRFLFDLPGIYRIRVQGHLGADRSDMFGGMAICTGPVRAKTATTTLTGKVIDQASLMGVLSTLYEMGYPLLEVKRLPNPVIGRAANSEVPA